MGNFQNIVDLIRQKFSKPQVNQEITPSELNVPNVSPLAESSQPSQPKEIQDYLEQLKRAPMLSAYHPSKLRQLGGLYERLSSGPEAQQKMLMRPYTKAYQDWADKLYGMREGITLPADIEKEKATEEELRGRGEYYRNVGSADLTKAQSELERAKHPKFMRVGNRVFDTELGTYLDDPNAPVKKTENERDVNDYLMKKYKVDYSHASPEQRVEAEKAVKEKPPSIISEVGADRAEYDARIREVNAIADPISSSYSDIAKASEMLNMGAPAIDPLVAPELLKTLVGGKGSNVRITQPEIQQVIGGRDAVESFQASLQKLISSDPTKPFMFPPEQRKQLVDFVNLISKKTKAKIDLADKARSDLIDTTNASKRRKIVNQYKKDIVDIDNKTMNQEVEGTIRKLVP